MQEKNKLRWYWHNTRLLYTGNGIVCHTFSDKYGPGNNPVGVFRSEICEKLVGDFYSQRMPVDGLVENLWEDLKAKLASFHGEKFCIAFCAPLVLRAEKEANHVYFWLEAQVALQDKEWSLYAEDTEEYKRDPESKFPMWREDDYVEQFGVRLLVPDSVRPFLKVEPRAEGFPLTDDGKDGNLIVEQVFDHPVGGPPIIVTKAMAAVLQDSCAEDIVEALKERRLSRSEALDNYNAAALQIDLDERNIFLFERELRKRQGEALGFKPVDEVVPDYGLPDVTVPFRKSVKDKKGKP